MKLRFVKFLTSRENEIEKKEDGEEEGPPLRVLPSPPAGRSQSSPRSHFCFLFLSSSHSPLPPLSPTSPHRPSQLVGRHVSGSSCPSYPSTSCSASPFLLHKITEAEERGGCHVAWYPACWSNYSVRVPSSPAGPTPRWPACPPLPLISKCGPSTSSGAIGKQRPKIRSPVPSPSLMNK